MGTLVAHVGPEPAGPGLAGAGPPPARACQAAQFTGVEVLAQRHGSGHDSHFRFASSNQSRRSKEAP